MRHVYPRSAIVWSFSLCLVALSGCPDSPFFRTPLPNGYEHESNGGELGEIVMPTSARGARVVAPLGDGPNGRKQYCNEFGWAGDLVVGEVIEYAERAFVQPPVSRRYLILDTTTETTTYFDTRAEAAAAWREMTQAPFPELRQGHPSTTTR